MDNEREKVIQRISKALNEILANATINDGSKIKEIVSGLSLLDEKYVDAIITLINGLNNQKK